MPLRTRLQRIAQRVHEAGTVNPPPEGAMMRATYLHLGVAGLGFGALVSQHVAPGPAFGASLAVFVVLCGALYHRRAGWVSALLGTTFALAAAAAVAYFFFGVLAACGAGLAAGALAVHTYLRILRRSGLAP